MRKLLPVFLTVWVVGLSAQDNLFFMRGGIISTPQKVVTIHRMTPLPLAGGAFSTVAAIKTNELPQYVGWVNVVKVFDQGPSNFRTETERMYQAIAEYNVTNATTLRACLMAGGLSGDTSYQSDEQNTILASETYSPAQWFIGGRPVISAYSTNSLFWTVVSAIESGSSVTCYALPSFQWRQGFSGTAPGPYTPGWSSGEPTSFTNGGNDNNVIWLFTHQDNARADGFALWDITVAAPGTYGVANEDALMETYSAVYGKSWSANVYAFQKGLPHKGNTEVKEGHGFDLLAATWTAAIDHHAPFIEFITANDMSESSYIVDWPSSSLGYTDAPYIRNHWNAGDNPGIPSHRAYREISAYYSAKYRTGNWPAIPALKVYYAYRPSPRDAVSYSALSSGDQSDMTAWLPDYQQANETLKGNIYVRASTYVDYSDGVHLAILVPSGTTINAYIEGTKVIDSFAGPGLAYGTLNGSDGTTLTGQTNRGYGTTRYIFDSSDVAAMDDGPYFEVRAGDDSTVLISGHGKLPVKPWRYTQDNPIAYELQNGDTAITPPSD